MNLKNVKNSLKNPLPALITYEALPQTTRDSPQSLKFSKLFQVKNKGAEAETNQQHIYISTCN